MTQAEALELDARVRPHLQNLLSHLWRPDGRPSSGMLELNPHSKARMRHFVQGAGNRPGPTRWADVGGGGGEGGDLVELVAFMGDIDREKAAEFLRDFLAREEQAQTFPPATIWDRPQFAPPERVPGQRRLTRAFT